MIGIYRIVNKINNKCYVGQSIDINNRIKSHFYYLSRNWYGNYKLQNAWNKYGEDNFYWEVIEECLEENLDEREIYWISFYNSFNNGYNQTQGGQGTRGYIWSSESKAKMSESIKQWWKNNHYRLHPDNKGSNNPFYGCKHTEDSKRKIREARMKQTNVCGCSRPGKLNPRYGVKRKWINNGSINKQVKLDELDIYLKSGWMLGRIKSVINYEE